MSSVFSMELEGISKAWRLKVMMNRPVTRTTAMEARNSMGVSFFFSSGASVFAVFGFLLTVCSPVPGNRRGRQRTRRRKRPQRTLVKKRWTERIKRTSLPSSRERPGAGRSGEVSADQ